MKEVAERIAAEIRNRGVISFARFMELALYCPEYGFYQREKDTIGKLGNFYTSASVGELFGHLLAFQFAQWLDQIEPCHQLVEAGAHQGQLARDILLWLHQHRPDRFERVEYIILEPSQRRIAWQAETLGHFGPKVRWARDFNEVGQIGGVIFSNELLDAMPVHRLRWNRGRQQWTESGVTMNDGRFVWAALEETSGRQSLPECVEGLPRALLEVLPDGFAIEICPAAEQWWQQAALTLRCGKLITIDYGLTTDELIRPERTNGTLRAYHRHQFSSDLLANPGEQDLTAHLNFSVIENAGVRAGLRTELLQSQSKFLTRILAEMRAQQAIAESWPPEWTRQFQTLTSPEHLGESFRVLVQAAA